MYFWIYLFLKETHLFMKTPGITFPLLVCGGVLGAGAGAPPPCRACVDGGEQGRGQDGFCVLQHP